MAEHELAAVNRDHNGGTGPAREDVLLVAEGLPIISSTDATLARIVSLEGVDSVKPIGFDLYAVTSTVTRARLEAMTGVEKVIDDVALAAASVDEYFPLQWPLENTGSVLAGLSTTADADVNGTEAWHRTRGAGVVVAVIDTGVDVDHPDLSPNIWTNPAETCGNQTDDDHNGYVDDCRGWDFVNDDATAEDQIGHGTHIAGIIAAAADNRVGIAGMAYEAKVMALKVGDETPILSAAIEAFAYAIANGARIINASWVTDGGG
jgi:subtilisin family serine protease